MITVELEMPTVELTVQLTQAEAEALADVVYDYDLEETNV
jgi:hypothetical protein